MILKSTKVQINYCITIYQRSHKELQYYCIVTQISIYGITRSLIPTSNHYSCAMCLNNWPTQWWEQFISPWRKSESACVCGTDCFSGIECCHCVLALIACFHAKYRTVPHPRMHCSINRTLACWVVKDCQPCTHVLLTENLNLSLSL